MADPRLRWNQIAAPDLSGASAAIARAGQALNTGLGSASSLLEKYSAGQKEKADAELLSELAGLSNEAEFDAFIDGGGLQGRNISTAMRDHVLGARTGFVQDAGRRANTNATIASTAIARAAEGRAANEYAYNSGRRDELADLSGLVVGANQEGNQFGRGAGDNVIPDSYYDTLIGSESSNDPNARNSLSSATGLAQFTDETWEGMMRNYPELELTADGRTDPVQSRRALQAFTQENAQSLQSAGIPINGGSLYAAHFLGARTARSVLTQPDDVQLTDVLPAKVIKANPFLEGMSVGRFREWSAEKGGGNGVSFTPRFDRLQAALGNSQYLSPSDINALLGQAYEAQGIGQGRLDSAEVARVQAASDAAVLGAFSDPTVMGDDPASILAAAQGAGLNAGATLDLFGRLNGAVESNQGIFNPQAPADPIRDAALQAEAEERARLAENNPQNRVITQAQDYDEDPISSISKRFDVELSVSDREQLDDAINTLADNLKISRGEAALSIAENFTPDPFGLNTISNRIDSEGAVRFARENFSTEARRRANDVNAVNVRDTAQVNNATSRLQDLQSEALRYQAAGREVPPAIAREINKIEDTLRAGSTPEAVQQQLQTYIARSGMASRLQGLDPESPEFFRAMADLESAIQSDRLLGSEEKRLLISAIRG